MSIPAGPSDVTEGGYVFRCGCTPSRGDICSTHCQWQGCAEGRHTEACVAGERVPVGSRPTLVCGCGTPPDGAPGATGCSPSCMLPVPEDAC